MWAKVQSRSSNITYLSHGRFSALGLGRNSVFCSKFSRRSTHCGALWATYREEEGAHFHPPTSCCHPLPPPDFSGEPSPLCRPIVRRQLWGAKTARKGVGGPLPIPLPRALSGDPTPITPSVLSETEILDSVSVSDISHVLALLM